MNSSKKEKKQLKKDIRQRKQYNKLKRKEYTKEYLQKKDARHQLHQSYPNTRLVLVRDFLRSRDLYKAIGLFLGSQLSIFLLLVGVDYPDYAPVIGMISIFIGLVSVIFTIREINKRQTTDITRKPVSWKLVFKILALALFATTLAPIILSQFGIVSSVQPNQEAVQNTLSLFPIPMIFTTLIVAPFIEEIIFRELLPYATGPSKLSFIVTSFLFIAIHSPSGALGWVNYGIIGIGFLSARLINNNIYTGIIIHLIWNTLSLIL